MKKFLTVLLALSVVFTYTVGSAFAATPKTYYAADYATALNAEKTTQLGYLESDLNQVVNGFTYVEGYYNGYAKAAYEASAKDILADFGELMDVAIRTEVDKVPAEGTTVAPNAVFSVLTAVVYKNGVTWEAKTFSEILGSKDFQKDAIKDNADALNKKQAEIGLVELEAVIAAVDLTKYDAENLKYDEAGLEATNPTMTAAAYVQYLIDKANKAISDVADKKDGEKVDAYKAAKAEFKEKLKVVKTIEEEQQENEEAYKTVEAALAGMKAYATGAFYEANKLNVPAADETVVLTDFFKNAAFYTAKTSSKNATVFGVEVKDIAKVTRAEAIAINNALFDAAVKSIDTARVYAGTEVAKVTALFNKDNHTIYTKTLANAVTVADRYAEVVEYGVKLKTMYMYGVKVYDDAKVDEAVKAAEALVYADLGATLQSAEAYVIAAANKIYKNDKGLANLEAVESAYDKLMDAIADAKAKFDGNIINYGTNATPEADKVFKIDYYASSEATDFNTIKAEYKGKLDSAQSYAEIENILADAKTELAKLMTKADEKDTKTAIEQYKQALWKYAEEQKALANPDKKYTKNQFEDARDAGFELINKATTVAGAKDAYEAAKALFKDIKSDDELKEMAKAVDALVAAIPYSGNITVNDKAQIDAAREAYDAYLEEPGADETDFAVITKTTLKAAEDKVAGLQKKALTERLDAFVKEAGKIPMGDAAIQTVIDMKENAQALYNDIYAFNKYVEDYNEAHAVDLLVSKISGTDFNALAEFVSINEGDVWSAEVARVQLMIIKAVTGNATMDELKAALGQYKNLTERQQYAVSKEVGFSTIDLLKNKIISTVESLKIKTSTKLYTKSNKIRVNWKVVDGDAAAADGYYVYKSTKAQTGYKYMGKTTKSYMDNKKNLKKGKRYYYKVKAYVVIDGQKYFSDDSNKGNRIYR